MDDAKFKRREEIPVVVTKTLRHNIKMVIGVMRAGELVGQYIIPRRDHTKKRGYQREVSKARVNRLVKELIKRRVDLPTALLLNLRDFDPDTNIVERDDRFMFCPGNKKYYVVDGQHRVEALSRVVDEVPDKWKSFEIPFVCMLGADESEEMNQFYIVNSTAKSVRTDLALDLLKQQAESDPSMLDSLTERGEQWKVRAQAIAEGLSKTPLWLGRIRFPGYDRGETTISSGGLVMSMKQVLGTPYFGAISMENQIRIVAAYWQGIKRCLPEVFDRPLTYTLQKASGVNAMHTLLTIVLEIVRSKGHSVAEPNSYAEILKETLRDLEGDTATGDVAKGSDFWLAGEEGAAGSFSSNAGRRVLLAKIRASLPEMEVE